jgi:hypothetical protein
MFGGAAMWNNPLKNLSSLFKIYWY